MARRSSIPRRTRTIGRAADDTAARRHEHAGMGIHSSTSDRATVIDGNGVAARPDRLAVGA